MLKCIKKNIYGKLQTVKIIYPPGFAAVALSEIQTILADLWLPKKMTSEVTFINNEIIIRKISMFSIIELLTRSRSLTDIRLIIFQGKTIGQSGFKRKCLAVFWDYYLNQSMSLKIKINSVASKAFHETALKKILGDIVKDYVDCLMSGEAFNKTTTLYADLYKDKLTLSISLAGEPLYKRGYRTILKASAPLREDSATCCIKKALQFFKENQSDFLPNIMMIPFSGTGTFVFEYLLDYFELSPLLFDREYALQKMPLFRLEHFKFLLKKANDLAKKSEAKTNFSILCIDHSEEANRSLLENRTIFNKMMEGKGLQPVQLTVLKDNFLKVVIDSNHSGNIFIPLNPPYGIRLNKQSDSIILYKNIAKKINEIATFSKKNNNHVLGFILCPSEETWSAFLKNIKPTKTETYHFTQGGKDIRVCQFYI